MFLQYTNCLEYTGVTKMVKSEIISSFVICLCLKSALALFIQEQDRFRITDNQFYKHRDKELQTFKPDVTDSSMRMYGWSASDHVPLRDEDARHGINYFDNRARYFRTSDDTDRHKPLYQTGFASTDKDKSELRIQSFIKELRGLLKIGGDTWKGTGNDDWYKNMREKRMYGIKDFMKDFSTILS